MKRLFGYALPAVLFFIFLFRNTAVARDQVIVGVYSHFPLVFMNDRSEPDGFFVDILKYVADRENWSLEYRYGTLAEVIGWLKEGSVDLVCAMGYDEESVGVFHYSSEVSIYSEARIYASRQSRIRNVEDFNGATIAVVKDDSYYASFRNLAGRIGINCNFLETGDYDEVLRTVNDGQADAGIVCLFYGISFANRFRNIRPVQFDYKPVQMRFAVLSGRNSDVIEAIDHDYLDMVQNRRAVFDDIYNRWLKGLAKKLFPTTLKWVLIGVGGFLIFLAATSLILKSQVKRQTLQLVVKNEELEQEIKERKEAEKARRDSENISASLLSHAPNPILVINSDGKIHYVNNAAVDITGFSANELIGLSMPFPFWPKDIANEIHESIEKGMKSGGRFVFQFEKKDGKRFWVDVTISPVFDETGALKHVLSMWLDITERIKIEEDLENRVFERTSQLIAANDELENLNEITKQLSMTLDFDSVFDKAATFITSIYGFEGCLYLSADMENGRLIVVKVAALPDLEGLREKGETMIGSVIHLRDTDCPVRDAISENRSIMVERDAGDKLDSKYILDFGEMFDDYHIMNLMILPVNVKNEVIGTFFLTTHSRLKVFTGDEIESVKRFGNQIALVVKNSILYDEMGRTKNELEKTLDELKQAQKQIIIQEKMASLGELTAGIAHEIKNPLNFVNNFAVLSTELAEEIKNNLLSQIGKMDKDILEDSVDLLNDLEVNLAKINDHGKRADSIVQGMLLHSRGRKGEKYGTDINKLLDEAVNLAYHGLRAKDSSFNIAIEKDYDESIGSLEVIPQDMSRVFINMVTNACYAASLRAEEEGSGFQPTLRVSTKAAAGEVQIGIWDNGIGIPDTNLDRIFAPFFTTKPAGQGTGLGLSICYEIVVDEHRGKIVIDTKVNDHTSFTVVLPQNETGVKDDRSGS